MNLTCVRGRGSQSGKPKSLVSVITLTEFYEIDSPKTRSVFFAEDSGNPLVKLPLPLRKQQMNHCQPFAFWRNKGHFIEGFPFHVLQCSDLSCIQCFELSESCQGKRGQRRGKGRQIRPTNIIKMSPFL